MPAAPDPKTLDPDKFDITLTPHILTDKTAVKFCPCTECRRCCVVTTFMAPAKVKCNECSGTATGTRETGTQAVVQPGRTDPARAVNLVDTLINKEFAHAVCPLGEDHTMELKDVCHVPNYGPRQLIEYKDGIPRYDQKIGELVTHQCLTCATTVQYSTTHPKQLRRVNEPRHSDRNKPGPFEDILGVRDEEPGLSEVAA